MQNIEAPGKTAIMRPRRTRLRRSFWDFTKDSLRCSNGPGNSIPSRLLGRRIKDSEAFTEDIVIAHARERVLADGAELFVVDLCLVHYGDEPDTLQLEEGKLRLIK